MKVLFMCVANSARSQLAEGVAKQIFGDKAEIQSAGSRPSQVNPFAIRALKEIGADTNHLRSKSCDELPDSFIANLDFVITLCAEEVCPVIISKAKKMHWPLTDPAGKAGSDDTQLELFRQTRDAIRIRLEEFSRNILQIGDKS